MSCAGQTPRYKDIYRGVLPPLGVRLKIPFCCLRRCSSHTHATSWTQALMSRVHMFLHVLLVEVFCGFSHPCVCHPAERRGCRYIGIGVDLYSRSVVLHACLMQMPFRPVSFTHCHTSPAFDELTLGVSCGAMMGRRLWLWFRHRSGES